MIHEAWQEKNLMALLTSPMPLRDWKTQKLQQFVQQGFPHRKMERWKYTPVNTISSQVFSLASAVTVDKKLLQQWILPEAYAVVFVNGHYAAHLSQLDELPAGVKIAELKSILDQKEWQAKLTMEAKYETPFSVLNDALFVNGLFIYLPSDVKIERPIQFIYYTDAGAHQTMSHPRNLMVAAKNSQAVIVEEYVGAPDVTYFNNVVTQIYTEENAHIHYYKLQHEGERAFHVANTVITQKNSNVTSYHLNVGAQLARDDINYLLQQANANCQLYGFYQLHKAQHADYHTQIDHQVPHCESRQDYRGIIDDRAHAVFNGKIIVHPGAEKIQAHQANKNLLLAKTAAVDTKPELEIYADDVRCTHGATVGQLDPQALFYLRSRGIAKSAAEKILTQAFAQEFIAAIPLNKIANKVAELIGGNNNGY